MNSVIFSILLALIEKRKVSRTYLSDKFEISPRTVSRYIDILLESGVPVLSLPGKAGGYIIPDDYKMDKTLFTQNERKRVINALNATNISFNDGLNTRIIEKLCVFDKPDTQSMAAIENNFIIDASAWGAPNLYRHKIDVINQAINNKNTLLIKYTDRHEIYSERRLDPYNLVLKQNVWYVYGWCHERNDFRFFKLSRIKYMVICDSTFTLRDDADVYEKLSEQFDTYDEVDIVIEFSSLILSQIEEWLGIDAIYEEGLNYRAAALVYAGNELVSKILSFGSGVKVISPAALKEEVLIECKRILNNV